MVFSSTAAAAQQQQYSSSGGGEVESLFLVPAPRVKPERHMKKMEHRSETFLQGVSILRNASRIVEQQKQQHSSSSTAAAAQQQQHSSSDGSDIAATDDKDERGYTGELFVAVLALSRAI